MRRKITNRGNYPVIEAEDRLFTFENELKRIHTQFSYYIPRGNGRCYGDASLAKQTITTTHYNKVLFFNDNWNKGYSRKGFIQYQFVLPLESKEGLINILRTISKKGLGSILAALKIFGKQDSLISFPMEGYTLALDIPVSKNLFPILDELDELVLLSGGRLYMSKDARMKASILKNGYPRLSEFIKIMHKYDPDDKLIHFCLIVYCSQRN